MAEEDNSQPLHLTHACCAVHTNKKCYILNFGVRPPFCNINIYNFGSSRWHTAETVRTPFEIEGCCYSVIKDRLYAIGGWAHGKCEANIHELNLNNYKWRIINPTNPEEVPLCKYRAGMVDYGEEMLCMMGGYGWHPPAVINFKHQQGVGFIEKTPYAMTNELHIFHINSGEKKYFMFTNFNLLFVYT